MYEVWSPFVQSQRVSVSAIDLHTRTAQKTEGLVPQLPRATKFGVRAICSKYSISCRQCSGLAMFEQNMVQHCSWTYIAWDANAVQM